MDKGVVFSETVFTTLVPERVFKVADECLLEIRLMESRRESAVWIYEYEVSGEPGRIKKFLVRIRNIEIKFDPSNPGKSN